MRLAALTLLAFGLVATAAMGSAKVPVGSLVSAGSLSIEKGRGAVQITGTGVLVGRMEKGTLEIVDLTSGDRWSPRINGIPRGRKVWLRGKEISFYIPGGRYRLLATGADISISARGAGAVVLEGEPDAVGDSGTYAVGDEIPVPIPVAVTKLVFGAGEPGSSSSQSGKISP